MVSTVWDPRRNWKVQAMGGKDTSESSLCLRSKKWARGHRKTKSAGRLKDKEEKLTSTQL